YSLGATLYFLLTGQPLYVGQTPMDTLIKHRESPIPALAAARPDAPAALEAVFRRMLAKTPEARYQSMAEVVRDLEALDLRADVVVSSLHLADMNGLQLAQQVRADRDPAPGFVLISSETQGAEAKQFTLCAQSILLRKPFSPKELVEALCLVVGRPK